MTSTAATRSGSDSEDSLTLRRGDHLRAGHPGALHHDGIYLGDGRVIHLVGPAGTGKAGARVQIDPLTAFAARRPVTVRPYAPNHNPDEIIARAMSKLGQGGYDLISNNCQHFARWCATGDRVSEQITAVAATTGTVAAPVAGACVGISAIGSAGIVEGLSGPGIMSGLAACGSVVGGGAVAGLLVLGAMPGITTVAVMNHALRKDDDLPGSERTARLAGRIGAAAGAVGGAAGSIAAVSALGFPGLSAAGISSGLAAIGGATVGGGMAAGTMCVIAAPAVAAAVLGYLIYRLVLADRQRFENQDWPAAIAGG
jgi:hypothetical protein